MELAPGIMVTDNVRLVSKLGEGGMGAVWVADHLSLKTQVAVKFVSAELIKEDPSIVTRFNREAALGAQIKSPHVVQMFDHGVMDDGRPYIVMELLEGESLQDRLEREGRLSPALTVRVIQQTAKALAKAHAMDVVHRDIKPDNLFLTYEDDEIFLKVLDFGIAKQTGLGKAAAVTSTGMMVGTPEYMSPEQVLSAKTVDFKADLWALAVVAYHCLTGCVPFSGETLGSLCVAIANGKFTAPSQLRPDLPPAVNAWFAKALEPEPNDRHASAKELAVTLAQAVAGLAAVAGGAQAVADEMSFTDAGTVDPGVGAPADWSGGHGALGSLANAALGDTVTGGMGAGGEGVPAQTNADKPSPTFTGTSVRTGAPSGSRRVAVIGSLAAAVLLGAGAVAVAFGSGGSAGTDSAATAQPEASETAANADPPKPTGDPSANPAVDPAASAQPGVEPAASGAASASASAGDPPPVGGDTRPVGSSSPAAPKPTTKVGPGVKREPKPTATADPPKPKPTSTSKDWGF